MTFEGGLDDAALDAAAATVDDAHVAESSRYGRIEVFLDNRRDLARRKAVEIQFALDGNMHGIHHGIANGKPQGDDLTADLAGGATTEDRLRLPWAVRLMKWL